MERGNSRLVAEKRSEKPSAQAEDAFAEYRDLLDGADPPSFAAFCALHPELKSELQQLEESWRYVSRLVERLGLRSPTRPPEARAPVGTAEPVEQEGGSVAGTASVRSDGDLLTRLAAQNRIDRYRTKQELKRGGMGVVHQVWDLELRRSLAMKTIVPRGQSGPSERELGRFLEEAQITGQLDHPGIVPVHELGLDHEGRLFFTMRLVRGRTLDQVFDLAERGEEGWSVTRALGAILRICETMSFAHDRGVIHRDLKPANVMVGRFGEVYVMDWGLARVLGQEDQKDIRLAGAPTSHVWTERKEHLSHEPDSPLITMDGDVVGTPAFMSPEQAEGRVAEVGPASDVYSVGGILYQLLSGTMPYGESRTPVSPHVLWRRVLTGAPAPLESLARDVAPELIAITERAMARAQDERYASMEELASDLRAYLEGRVVPVYERGPIAELRKWVRRNRGFALASAALVVVALGAALLYAWNESRRTEEIERFARVAQANERIEAAARLGAVRPEALPAYEAWVASARPLLDLLPGYEAQRDELRARALPLDETQRSEHERAHPLSGEARMLAATIAEVERTIEGLRSGTRQMHGESMSAEEWSATMERYMPWYHERVQELQATIAADRPWSFGSPHDREVHDQLDATCKALTRLADQTLAGVTRDTEQARALQDVMAQGGERWSEARAAIESHAVYGGLVLTPQMGLVPLGPDQESGLWEFWHVLSGAEPARDAHGRLALEEDSGVVLVLLPGATATIGAQNDPNGPNYDPEAQASEAPIEVQLDPYFLSKYELTQGQWLRLTDDIPSFYCIGSGWQGFGAISGLHPVENVSWEEAMAVLLHVGLELPTEARWEFGARSLAEGPYWFGDHFTGEHGVNFFDASSLRAGGLFVPPGAIDDGFSVHAPVQLMPANAYGLHGVLGNVRELCLDRWSDQMGKYERRAGTSEILSELSENRSVRGGSFFSRLFDLRLGYRMNVQPGNRAETIGVRPARSLEQ